MTPTINKPMLKELKTEMDEALKAIANKHGLRFYGIGRIRFDPTSFRTQFEMTAGEPAKVGALGSFPFKEGEEIQMAGSRDTFRVVRFSRRGLPVVESSRGKLYKVPERLWPTCRTI